MLLPVKWLWALSMAKLGGRLQTNKCPLQAAELVTNLLQPPPFNDNKGWSLEYKIALAWLDLRQHRPSLTADALPKQQDPMDLYILENLGMSCTFQKKLESTSQTTSTIACVGNHFFPARP
jgi:hypothetical protein